MQKTILITGATDGIGLETANMLAPLGHTLLLHGRNSSKLEKIADSLSSKARDGAIKTYEADLSNLKAVTVLADLVSKNHAQLDVLINNAGVYSARNPITQDGLDVRFAVNTIAPYLLTRRLLPLFAISGRVINLSSAAQVPVDLEALTGQVKLSDGMAYAQSKLALTMWSHVLARSLMEKGPAIIAVNPGSMLGSKMVKQAFGVAGSDLRMGAEILTKMALSQEFEAASGLYFDNDAGRFAEPHPDALDQQKSERIVRLIEAVVAEVVGANNIYS